MASGSVSSPTGLVIEELPGGVRVLRLERPERRNALSPALIEALIAALDSASRDGVRVLRLEAGGDKAFCAGYDLDSLAAFQQRSRPDETGEAGGEGDSAPDAVVLPDEPLGALFDKLERHPAPTVALIHGAAYGAGCELAAACDFRIGTQAASFCIPAARLGVVYADQGIARLWRLVGPARAKRMFLTGLVVDAPLALTWGLLDAAEPDLTEARGRVEEWCAALARGKPLAVAGMKETFVHLGAPALSVEHSRRLRRLRYEAFLSEDARASVEAFVSGRAARSRE